MGFLQNPYVIPMEPRWGGSGEFRWVSMGFRENTRGVRTWIDRGIHRGVVENPPSATPSGISRVSLGELPRPILKKFLENRPISQSINHAPNKSIGQSFSQSISHSISQSFSRSISQSISQPMNPSARQPVSQSTNQSVRLPGGQSINQAASQTINQ